MQHAVQIAALRYDRGVFDCLRQILKELPHLGFGFIVLLRRIEFGPTRVFHHIPLRNSHADFVRLEVLFIHELDGVRRNQRQLLFNGKFRHPADDDFFTEFTDALDLKVEPPRKRGHQLL